MGLLGLTATVGLNGCGNNTDQGAASAAPSTLAGLGNFNLNCDPTPGSNTGSGTSTQGSKQQVQFQQQQQTQCGQKFQFQQQTAADFDVTLDCNQNRVLVKNKGADSKQQVLPIQEGGKIQGQMQFQQQLQNDGKGNQVCWLENVVTFDGKAVCEPTPAPSTTPKKSLSLTTKVEQKATTSEQLSQAGISGASPSPSPSVSPSPSASPSASGSPSPSPSVSPSPSPSASPSPSPSASPSAHPSPSTTPVVVCIVQDPCPVVGKTDLSCPQ